MSGHALNLLQFGDDQAQQLGLPVTRTRALILMAASLATAAAVSFSGIIGFIGLIVPHVMRLWFGADYRRLVPLSLIGGAAASAAVGCAGACDYCPAGIAGRDRHSSVRRAVLLMGAAAGKEPGILVTRLYEQISMHVED